MSSLRITKDFNCGRNLRMAGFTSNNVRNEITGELFRRVEVESKLSTVLWPHLLELDEPTCRASRKEEVAIYLKHVLIDRVRLPICSKVVELLQYYRINPGQITSNGWLIWTCFTLLRHRKRLQYHLEVFRQYYKLIPAAGGGTRVGGRFRDVGYFTVMA